MKFFFDSSIEKLTDNLFKKTKIGELKVIFPSNNKRIYKGKFEGPNAEISLNNYKLLIKIFNKGPVGLAESYMDKDFTTKDLSRFLLFAKHNQSNFLEDLKTKWTYKLFSKFKHYLNQNTTTKSKKNISFHYDLGNKFYKLWLDDSMTYSSAIFNDIKNYKDLNSAQINKYKLIADSIKLNDNSNLLEIGCGWGSFSMFAAKNFGSKVKAITLSKEQYNYVSKKISKEGLNEKVSVELRDYREVEEKFDKIVSIEMFEAVGKEYWHTFFDKIKNCLKDQGVAALQIITIKDENAEYYQKNPDFIQQYIFPGGVLPSKKQLCEITSLKELKLEEKLSFGISYAKTLNLWNEKFQNSWSLIADQGFTPRFKRMWEYYLAYCEIGFITKYTDVSQFIVKK